MDRFHRKRLLSSRQIYSSCALWCHHLNFPRLYQQAEVYFFPEMVSMARLLWFASSMIFFFLSALLRKVQNAIMSTRSEISDLESRNLQSASKNNLCSVVCMLQWCNRHTSASLKNTSQSTPRFVLARTISYKSKGIRCYDWICMCNCHLKREIKLCSQFATCWTICSTASWN